MVKACKVAGSELFNCAAHGLHNLIAVDGISKGLDVQTIISKIKDTNKTFTFKSSLLENEQLVAGLKCILEDIDKDQEIGFF